MIITKTPYRLSLFGGGTDYPAWFEKNPSKIISAAMANYCWVHVKELPPFFDHTVRVTYSKTEHKSDASQIEHPAIRACLQHMGLQKGISIGHDGDLPARSGIGSSSAFTVGLLHALYAYQGRMISKENLAKEAIHVEQNVIGENVGIQDQIMASYGGIRVIDMGPGNNWTSNSIVLSDSYMKELESHIMLGFSGVSRHSETQSKKKVDNIKNGNTDNYLKQMMQLTDEAHNSIMKCESMDILGELFNKGWHIKRNLADGISEDWIDNIYNKACQYGAYGGKLMGAGGGGFFMFLVPPEKQNYLKEKLSEIKVWVPFKFDTQGSQIVLYS